MFSLLRRGRCCVWLAGTIIYNADEPDSWPGSDYGQVFRGFLTSTRTAGIVNLYVRTCSRTTRVTALRMGGFEVARWREKTCCVIPKRVAGVGFATFMEHTFPLRFFEYHCFLLFSPSCRRGECLICSTFYSVLGQGLGSDPPGLRPPPLGRSYYAHQRIICA